MDTQITIEADGGEREEMNKWLAEHKDFDIHAKFMAELAQLAKESPVEFQKMVDDCNQAMDEEFEPSHFVGEVDDENLGMREDAGLDWEWDGFQQEEYEPNPYDGTYSEM